MQSLLHYCCSLQDIVNDKDALELQYFVVRLSDTVTNTTGFSIDKPLLPSFLFMGAIMRTRKVTRPVYTHYVQLLTDQQQQRCTAHASARAAVQLALALCSAQP